MYLCQRLQLPPPATARRVLVNESCSACWWTGPSGSLAVTEIPRVSDAPRELAWYPPIGPAASSTSSASSTHVAAPRQAIHPSRPVNGGGPFSSRPPTFSLTSYGNQPAASPSPPTTRPSRRAPSPRIPAASPPGRHHAPRVLDQDGRPAPSPRHLCHDSPRHGRGRYRRAAQDRRPRVRVFCPLPTSIAVHACSSPLGRSDAFQRRERASEDYAIRQREKEKLLELKKKLAEQQQHLDRLSKHMFVKPPPASRSSSRLHSSNARSRPQRRNHKGPGRRAKLNAHLPTGLAQWSCRASRHGGFNLQLHSTTWT